MFNEVQYLNTHFTDFCILKTVTLTIKSKKSDAHEY